MKITSLPRFTPLGPSLLLSFIFLGVEPRGAQAQDASGDPAPDPGATEPAETPVGDCADGECTTQDPEGSDPVDPADTTEDPTPAGSDEQSTGYGKASVPCDVGIVPVSPWLCPPGSEYIEIHTDDEDDRCDSHTSGFTGAIRREGSGTTLAFCRVDGTRFSSVPTGSYAVLSLDDTCPNGSTRYSWFMDNENNNNDNWATGDHAPNVSSDNTTLVFCEFPPGSSGDPSLGTSFPDFGVPYGVFAKPIAWGMPAGHVHIDDEDSPSFDPASGWTPFSWRANSYIETSSGHRRLNTEIDVAQVR